MTKLLGLVRYRDEQGVEAVCCELDLRWVMLSWFRRPRFWRGEGAISEVGIYCGVDCVANISNDNLEILIGMWLIDGGS